jgi:hypothetical protein
MARAGVFRPPLGEAPAPFCFRPYSNHGLVSSSPGYAPSDLVRQKSDHDPGDHASHKCGSHHGGPPKGRNSSSQDLSIFVRSCVCTNPSQLRCRKSRNLAVARAAPAVHFPFRLAPETLVQARYGLKTSTDSKVQANLIPFSVFRIFSGDCVSARKKLPGMNRQPAKKPPFKTLRYSRKGRGDGSENHSGDILIDGRHEKRRP